MGNCPLFGEEERTEFSLAFLFRQSVFPPLLSVLGESWSRPWGLRTPNSVWWLDTTEQTFGVDCFNFILPKFWTYQVSFCPSLFPFLLCFRRSCVSTSYQDKDFSPFVLLLPLELDSFNRFLLLLLSSLVFLLLTSFPRHIHILSCPALLKETP